jgi:hypothetical protein
VAIRRSGGRNILASRLQPNNPVDDINGECPPRPSRDSAMGKARGDDR